MRFLASILLFALFLVLAGFAGYKLAGNSNPVQAPISEEKWQKEISARDDQIARLERDLSTLRNKRAPVALPIALSEKTNLPLTGSLTRSSDTLPASSVPVTMQNLTFESTNGGLSIKNLHGQPLVEISPNGNKLSFGTNTFFGPNGEIFVNRAAVAGDLRSGSSQEKVALTFKNRIPEEAYLYWIDFQGTPKFYKALKAGEDHRQETFLTHPWVVIDHDGTKLGELLPEKQDEEIVLSR
ncbi:MAG: hypothetical protein ABIR24_08690 [Verrucomicrobiota bacterium]